jgi:NAD(P)-dependent dehydrogenase (short-subunit alcohol dehydrogenase family)
MTGEFTGKVALITGAGGGLGRSVVERFGRAGAKLALVERNPDNIPPMLGELGLNAADTMTLAADVTDPASVDAAVAQFVQHLGQIDVLVHTVGGYAAGKPVHESGLDVWDKMMNLNARSVYVTAGSVARHMVEKNVKGRIIVVLARIALKGTTNHAAYAASKAAAQRVVESMAAELLTVNGIMPSTIDTPANRASMPNANYDKWVKPEQLADVIAFLASEGASAISGDSLPVYGQS